MMPSANDQLSAASIAIYDNLLRRYGGAMICLNLGLSRFKSREKNRRPEERWALDGRTLNAQTFGPRQKTLSMCVCSQSGHLQLETLRGPWHHYTFVTQLSPYQKDYK